MVHINWLAFINLVLEDSAVLDISISECSELCTFKGSKNTFFSFSVAHLNLGLTFASLGSKEKALKTLLRIESIADDGLKDPKTHLTTQVSALYNSGKLLLEMGRPLEAVTVLRKAENRAKAVNYQAQGILNVLGEAFHALNKTLEAELSFRAALELKPDHIPAYLTYGKLLAKNVSKKYAQTIYT